MSTTRQRRTVGAVMTSPVLTVEAAATLRKASTALRDEDVGTVVVLEGTGVAGILSERDVVRAIADGADPDQVWVGDVMTLSPRYLTVGEPLDDAVATMLCAGIRHLPVFDEGEVVGIVSIRDVAENLLS